MKADLKPLRLLKTISKNYIAFFNYPKSSKNQKKEKYSSNASFKNKTLKFKLPDSPFNQASFEADDAKSSAVGRTPTNHQCAFLTVGKRKKW
jgi:hypothetical protein